MKIKVTFPGNKKVKAEWGAYSVMTDQPVSAGGEGSVPAPFDLFLASIGTCAGFFALSFCSQRGLATEGLELTQDVVWDEHEHRVSKISLEIILPEAFPEKYRHALAQAVGLCTVKRHLQRPPEIAVKVQMPLPI